METIATPRPTSVDNRFSAVMPHVGRALGALTVLVGALVLAGWALDSAMLKSISTGSVSMKANTAAAFTLAGGALWALQRRGGARPRWGASILAGCVVFIGVSTLAEYALSVDLGIDQVLFRDGLGPAVPVHTSSPGRMSPIGALGFALMGASLLLIGRRTRTAARIAQGLTVTVLLMSFLLFLGYLYGASNLLAIAPGTRVAPHTLLTFLGLGLGSLAATPQLGVVGVLASGGAGGVLARRMLPASVIAPVILGALRLWGQRRGLYDTEMGLAIYASSNVVVSSSCAFRPS